MQEIVGYTLDNFAAFLSRLSLQHPYCHGCDAQAMRDACFWHDLVLNSDNPYAARGAQPGWW